MAKTHLSPSPLPKTELVDISTLRPDERNANRGTERGTALLQRSIEQSGAGRSIVLDKNGKAIAGNKSLEAWAALGGENVLIVETTGDVLVAVKRTDLNLDEPGGKARQLATADNRAAELNLNWDISALVAQAEQGLDIQGLWTEHEWAQKLAALPVLFTADASEASQPPLERAITAETTVASAAGTESAQTTVSEQTRSAGIAPIESALVAVQLFCTAEEHATFLGYCARLAALFATESPTQTVLRALAYADETICAEG